MLACCEFCLDPLLPVLIDSKSCALALRGPDIFLQFCQAPQVLPQGFLLIVLAPAFLEYLVS